MIKTKQLMLESSLPTGARRVKTPEEVTPAFAAVFCLYSADKRDKRDKRDRRDRSENGGVSLAENHSVGAEGNFPNLPSLLTFFWAQRSPWTEVAQNWHKLPQCCQAQALVTGANAVLSSPHFLVLM